MVCLLLNLLIFVLCFFYLTIYRYELFKLDNMAIYLMVVYMLFVLEREDIHILYIINIYGKSIIYKYMYTIYIYTSICLLL